MKARIGVSVVVIAAAALIVPTRTSAQEATANWSAVESALGRKGAAQPGDVMKFSFPRSDLTVVARGVTLKPAFALGTWAAFKRVGGGQTMAMGDLVLLEGDLDPVMAKLQAGGVEQTAIHHHVLGEAPRIIYMHFSAHGDEVKIAQTLHDALALTRTPLGTPAAPVSGIDLDTTAVAKALGYVGKTAGGVYQVAVPRAEKIVENGMEVPASMGLATAINFQPTGGGKAAILGDFVLTSNEVNPVIRALMAHGIEATSLHSHMLAESPRLFFMHFWANDDAVKLAAGLRAALKEMHVQAPTVP